MKRIFTLILMGASTLLFGQSFTKINASPIGTGAPTGGYAGASWIDFNGDGYVDLFVNQDFLYKNEGDGSFTRILNSGITGFGTGLNNGNSWADIDNDGDLDLALVNQNANSNGVYINNGDETFTPITTGDIGINLNAWSAAWADYDNDGFVDLMATHPCGFIGSCHTNWLFNNNGDGTFTEITSSDVTTNIAAYTVGNWADFDDDGDMDLFIGSGEVNFNSQDHIYINQLTETGTPSLVLNQLGTLFGDARDGQNWNLIDYDNDGDLDAFVTNYKTDVPNNFYSNNGDGTFAKLTDNDLGVHMVSEAGTWLGNTWGDFNNDGWLDVFITADFGSPFGNHFYLGSSNGTFTHHFPSFANVVGSRSTSNADYDNDGDLDLFINGINANERGLFRNELNIGANGNWINLTLEGTLSNRSAIGAKVRIKATINGQSYWQRRDISSQNAFCGQSDLRVHFGLGDATMIDSLLIEWPLGLKEVYTNIASNQLLNYSEGAITNSSELTKEDSYLSVFPNPINTTVNISYNIKYPNQSVQLRLFDTSMKVIKDIFNGVQQKGTHQLELDASNWPTGSYFLVWKSGEVEVSKKLVVIR